MARKIVVSWSLMPGVLKVPDQDLQRARPQAGLLLQLPPGRRLERFALDVAGARRRLEHHAVHGGPVLADQRHPPVGVDGDDGHRARGGG